MSYGIANQINLRMAIGQHNIIIIRVSNGSYPELFGLRVVFWGY